MGKKKGIISLLVLAALMLTASKLNLLEKETAMEFLRQVSERLGPWALPAYVAAHTLTIALCLPYAIFFEAGAPVLFGFLPAISCVFSAKVLGASLSFWVGRFGPFFLLPW